MFKLQPCRKTLLKKVFKTYYLTSILQKALEQFFGMKLPSVYETKKLPSVFLRIRIK